MKPYPFIVFSTAFVCLLHSPASAFVTTFPVGTYTPLGSEVAGKEDWTISDPGSDLNSDTNPDGFLSFVTSLAGSRAAAIGGVYNIPEATLPTTVFLSHGAPAPLQYTSFSTDFAIASSDEEFPGRDGFGFSFRDVGNNNLLTISLVPVASVDNDAYQVRYTIGANAQQNAMDVNDDPMFIYHNGLYSLDLLFTPNGANPTFSATITGTNSQTFSDVATGLGSSNISRFGAEWNVLPGQAGTNHLVFDNVSLIPEPSSALLIALTGLGFVTRRRRA
jgi:hypothetical protein